MDVFDKISDLPDKLAENETGNDPFYSYEPWDVEERPQWVKDQAMKDGVTIFDPEMTKFIGVDPHPFQSGYMLSCKPLRIKMGGTQIGKSIDALYEAFVMLTGEIPFSLRYPKGYDTGIKRAVTFENVNRFGRWDTRTKTFIDFNTKATIDTLSWDCGTIKGVGVYPSEKIAPEGEQVWIGTYQKPMTNYWWPKIADVSTRVIPDKFIDKTRGNHGLHVQKNTVYVIRNCKIIIITYESGHQTFEAEKAWAYIGDEEVLDQRIFQAAQQHARYVSLIFTPFNGITWSKGIVFPERKSNTRDLFHATQYDSPYQNRTEIEVKRETMKAWDIGARVWGIPTDVHGEPFFDRMKISAWINRFKKHYTLKKFVPSAQYYGIVSRPEITPIPGLMDTQVKMIDETEDNRMNVWRVYEERKIGIPYLLTVDPAEGANDPDAAADVCAALMTRPPSGDERKPVIVASLRSTLETVPFARTCSYAMRYYNNALLGAETKRGACNATFAGELRDWPYWYMFTSIQDSTGVSRQQKGFDTNASTRDAIFLLIEEWINSFEADQDPGIFDEPLLEELAKAITTIKSGKKRCDHTKDGTLDTTITLGIALYVYKHSLDQVKCNLFEEPKVNSHHRNMTTRPSPCGMSAMGYAKENYGQSTPPVRR